jgi:hypothetical protein
MADTTGRIPLWLIGIMVKYSNPIRISHSSSISRKDDDPRRTIRVIFDSFHNANRQSARCQRNDRPDRRQWVIRSIPLHFFT